jgi:phosphoglycerate dehydrogenase-like enzyme
LLNVLVTRPFTDDLIDRMRAVSPEIKVERTTPDAADYSEVDVLYADVLPADAPRLKWVQLHLAGINAIVDHPVYKDASIQLTTASGVHAAAAADYVMTVMLGLAHRVERMVYWKNVGAWPPDALRWPIFVPSDVRGATIGIIGYGSIGREVARIAKTAFGMTVLACKRDLSTKADTGYTPPGTGDPNGSLPDAWYTPSDLHELLRRSDFVVMAAPLTAATLNLIGKREIEVMKPSAYLINVGRGPSIDEDALAEALHAKRIAGAALDVFVDEPLPSGHPFYSLDNVILSPHVSGFIPAYDALCTELFVTNLRRYLDGAPLLNLVDRERGY